MYCKKKYLNSFNALYSDTSELHDKSDGFCELPDSVSSWLGRLKLLYGVPLNYLVADENMLPPESIKFFYLDPSWLLGLLDGAYSIGREPVVEKPKRSFLFDRASLPTMLNKSSVQASGIRAKLLGLERKHSDSITVSGFLLRSSIVTDYPGLGVNAYPFESTPMGDDPGTLLDILRMERLGSESDTLICLFDGDAHRIDIHEAPEGLHYGIDEYRIDEQGNISARKTVYPFTKDGPKNSCSITMNMKDPREVNMGESNIFREGAGSRTINMSKLANAIEKTIEAPDVIDASKMGFEMIEGVGMVSFYNKTR